MAAIPAQATGSEPRAREPRGPVGRSVRDGLSSNFPSLAAILTGVLGWEIIGQVADVAYFPPFSAVVGRLVALVASGVIIANVFNSLVNFIVAFAFSVVVGVTVGLLMGAIPQVQAALGIYVNALLTAPALVFAPIFFSVFGLGRGSIISLIIMYAIWLITISTADAVRGVDRQLLEMANSFMISRPQMFLKIMLPAALPRIMAGIRIGAGRGVKGMINGEMFIAAVGLGAVVQEGGRRFDAESVLAVLLVILAVAIVVDRIVTTLDQWLTSWAPSSGR
ncbi:MAG: ABC transporter permease subunit [Nitriliruptorales bacterium]|nr:ABC transporter permease subunit [Nitriliruptorales bacterium]